MFEQKLILLFEKRVLLLLWLLWLLLLLLRLLLLWVVIAGFVLVPELWYIHQTGNLQVIGKIWVYIICYQQACLSVALTIRLLFIQPTLLYESSSSIIFEKIILTICILEVTTIKIYCVTSTVTPICTPLAAILIVLEMIWMKIM